MKEGQQYPRFLVGQGLVQTGFLVATKQLLGFFTRDIPPAMLKNDRIDPFAATHTAPIDRTDFEHRLRYHDAAAAMTAFVITLLLSDGPL